MDDMNKQAALIGVVAFNIVFIFYQLAFNGLLFGQFTILKLILGFILGGIAGAGGFFAAKKMMNG